MEALLNTIVQHDQLHVRWLETLSHLENCGARKIMDFQPAVRVPLAVLQHAAEETRHAFYFKKLSKKLQQAVDAEDPPLFGGGLGRRYLHQLDLKIARALRQDYGDRPSEELKWANYYLSTYAIEKRAERVYPLYEKILRQQAKPFSLRGVIKEEEKHLQEIERNIMNYAPLSALLDTCLIWEEELFKKFSQLVRAEVGVYLKAKVL